MLLPNAPHPGGWGSWVCPFYVCTAQNVCLQCLRLKKSEKCQCEPNCIHMEWPSVYTLWQGGCLGVWCERGRGYSQTDVSVRTEKQQVCGLRSQTLTLWAFSCGLFSGQAEFKTKALSHFPCRVFFTCRLVAVASVLGILLFLLCPKPFSSCLVPSISPYLDQIFFYPYPTLADLQFPFIQLSPSPYSYLISVWKAF